MTRTAILAVLVGAVVALIAVPGFVKLDEPNSDGLFYEVQTPPGRGPRRGRGDPHRVRRRDRAARPPTIEDEPDEPRVLDPAWVEYSKRFYRRRWLVPALAAAVAPLVGDAAGPRAARGLADRLRADRAGPVPAAAAPVPAALSAVLALACTLAPPVYKWSLGMRVDSWGLLLEALGLLAVVLVKDLGRRWLAALGRRDRGAVDHPRRHGDPDAGGGSGCSFVERARPRAARRTNLALLGTGMAAALPAFLLGGTPVRDNLAYVIAGYNIPDESSWSYVASGYLDQLWRTISTDLTYPVDFATPGRVVLYARPGARGRGADRAGGAARRAATPTSR